MTQKGPVCSQCGRPAMYSVHGHPLCLQCTETVQRLNYSELQADAAALNFVLGQFQNFSGIPQKPLVVGPRPHAPQEFTMNSISVNNSSVGILNSGSIQSLRASIEQIQNQGHAQIASEIDRLVGLIERSSKLSAEEKQSALEGIVFVAEQAVLPMERRKRALLKNIAATVGSTLAVVANLAQIWSAICDALQLASHVKP